MDIFWLLLCCLLMTIIGLIIYFNISTPSNIPHPPVIPIFGHYLQFTKNKPYDYLINMGQIYGQIFQIKLGTQWAIVLNDSDLIKEAFASPKFASRPDWLSMVLQSESPYHFAFRASGPECKFLRKTSVKALSMLKMSDSSRVESHCLQAVKNLCEFLLDNENQPLNPSLAIFQCVCTIMGTISFGSEFQSDDRRLTDILNSAQDTSRLTRIGSFVDCFPWISILFRRSINLLREQNEIFDDYVIGKLKCHKKNQKVSDLADALGLISESYPDGSDDQMRAKYVAIDLFGAGLFTTLTNLEWAFLILAKHNHIQIRMRNEINSQVENDCQVTLAHKPNLPYSEAVLNEVLRFCTVLPFGVPHGTVEKANLKGYCISNKTAILPNLWAVHHDPSLFSDPYEFNPNRFLDETNNLNTNMTSRVISFSTGVRRCPGEHLARQNLFLIITNVVKSFTLNLVSEYADLNQCELNFSRKPLPYELHFIKL